MSFNSKDDSSISNPNSDVNDDTSDAPDAGSFTVSPNVSFANLGLNDWLVDALKIMSIRTPSEIQQACIPPILTGQDVIGGAKTGSGKTAAFALPILQKLSEDPYGVFALVLTPTRELAFQIAEQFRVLGKSINIKECVVVGGLDMMKQALELSRRPHVIIATPGRLRDHIQSSPEAVHLSRLRFLVLDEADRLLSSTFASDLESIFAHVPSKRQTLLFTATMTESILALRQGDRTPFVYQCDTRVSTVSTLTQSYVFVPSHVRETYLAYLLRCDDFAGKSTIVFCGRCATAELVTIMLKELGVRCTALHSEMTQQERLDSLGKFRAEVIKVLVATDVGSRGLDIPAVQLVLNYDVPRDPTDYIHRVGRTARAGRGGQAVTIVSERDVQLVQNIEQRTSKQMEEYKINENKILESLTEVSTAKRVASMVCSLSSRNSHNESLFRYQSWKFARRTSLPASILAVPTVRAEDVRTCVDARVAVGGILG
ncbi:P-loop containing nucleoside triphosphate hydrolase protein [Endogone sp. FLAS-F59071]|nr:P-loop containing nucleoside triphosphate hydrolase protein [Endogone sp. FLAS-F59071]|eukprot:RUS16767.1 P-loop containing nucleoside triphosphate hydrolase protein [Endogone sp. FLAS-F59071]